MRLEPVSSNVGDDVNWSWLFVVIVVVQIVNNTFSREKKIEIE